MRPTAIDTIAAIATAPGEGAIAVVRVSGPDSLAIADRVFRGPGGPPPSRRPANTFQHGHIVSEGMVADEVILLLYRAPRSYTREDAIEIQGHGGTLAARRILRAVLDAGARPAEPGEFTRRAFLNGRLDLVQAEGVLDLIRARSDRAAQGALEQLEGRLSQQFSGIYDRLLAVAAELEWTLDFAEDELPATILDGVQERIADAEACIKSLLATWDEGHLLREGALVVIAGKPNVGKSTLLNALLGKDRAIVTPIPGTTRDTIEEQVVINGYPVRFVDTAGLRSTDCRIEAEGMRRARNLAAQSDLIVYLMDATSESDTEDNANLKLLPSHKLIIVFNKCDNRRPTAPSFVKDQSVIEISALRLMNLDTLRAAILERICGRHGIHHPTTIGERHRRLLIAAHKETVESTLLLQHATPEVALAASRLRAALESIGEISGRTYHDELLDTIFSRFCIGK
jgi:tRNA modification GTPase